MKRYEQLAQEIDALIQGGTLRAGDRLPSVRQTCAGRGVSPSTVFEAYYLLEARGRIEARPRSGYYVSEPAGTTQPEPATAQPASHSTSVAISDLVFEVLGSTRDLTVVPLGSAFPSPSLFPLERLARCLTPAMRTRAPDELVEDLTQGNRLLRRQIALRYGRRGAAVQESEITITNGAMEALNLCLQVVTRPGDVVAVESPAFYGALQALERLQLRAVEVATHPRDGVDLDSLADVLQRHPVRACWFMPQYQNPLGSLMPDTRKQAMVTLLARHGVALIEDDVYGELHFGLAPTRPAKAYDPSGLVLHCSSFSKCLAPGYRVGWAAAGRFSRDVQRLKLMTTLSTAIPSQMALARYLQGGHYDRHLRQLRQTLAARQTVALEAIAQHFPAGTRVTRPDGGYFLWVELPQPFDALQLHHLALAQRISIAPGHLFSSDRRFGYCVRINYGVPDPARLMAALRTLGRLARGLAPQPSIC